MQFTDYLYRKAAALSVPLGGGFELTPVCNFKCRMCYIRQSAAGLAQSGKTLLPKERWLELAREMKDAGMLYLLLTGGEPFTYPDFRALYEALHDMGLILSVNSNGSLIDGETVSWLKQKMPARVNITLYGASPETYEKVTGNAAGCEKALRAVELLQAAGIPVVINVSLIPENEADLEAILRFGGEHRINTRVAPYMFPPVRRDAESGDSRLTPSEAARARIREYREVLDDAHYEGRLRHLCESARTEEEAAGAPDTYETAGNAALKDSNWGSRLDGESMFCRAGRSSFWVSWEGRLSACTMMGFPQTYDLREKSFRESWHELNALVKKSTVLAACGGCELKDICRPCAAMMLAESGDENKKAAYLCEMSRCVLNLAQKELEEMKQ